MLKVKDVVSLMEKLAPTSLKESFDNVGLLIGEENKDIKKVLLALDVTEEVVDEAINLNVDIIISHHPIIFSGIKSVNDSTSLGKKIIKLIKNDISVYCAHTNLDSCIGGTNDVLFDLLELSDKNILIPNENDNLCGLGRTGIVNDEYTLKTFINFLKDKLNLDSVVYSDDEFGLNKKVNKIGLCTGSAGDFDFINQSKKQGCDVFITGDLKFHSAQLAKELGIALIDATHYETEVIVLKNIKKYLESNSNLNILISEVDGQVIKKM